MKIIESMDFFTESQVSVRHWHPQSETYCGADSLLTAFSRGWQMPKAIVRYSHVASGRSILVYYIMLKQEDQTALMCLISNPFVERFLQQIACTIYTLENKLTAPSLIQIQKIAS